MMLKSIAIALNNMAEAAHQIGALGIIGSAVFQQPQRVYAVFYGWRRRGRSGQQGQISFGSANFALFQPFGEQIQRRNNRQDQDGNYTKQIFQVVHAVLS